MSTEIVTSKSKYDAEPLLDAIELACRFSEATDELEQLRGLRPIDKPSRMTILLSDAMSIVHDIRADEQWDSLEAWEKELEDQAAAEATDVGLGDLKDKELANV